MGKGVVALASFHLQSFREQSEVNEPHTNLNVDLHTFLQCKIDNTTTTKKKRTMQYIVLGLRQCG